MDLKQSISSFIPVTLVGLLAASAPAEAANPAAGSAGNSQQGRSSRDQPDDTLRAIESNAQRDRIEATEAFDIPVKAIKSDKFAKILAERCNRFLSESEFDKSSFPEISTPDLTKALPERNVDVRLPDSPNEAQQKAALETVQDHAKRIVGAMVGFRDVCKSIEAGTLEPKQLDLLRKIYNEEQSKDYGDFFGWLYKVLDYQSRDRKSGLDLLLEAIAAKDYNDAMASLDAIEVARGAGSRQGGIAAGSLSTIAQNAFEGLAEFLLERGKQELIDYLQDQFVSKVCSENNDPILFIPNTCEVLGKDLEGSLSIASMGAALHGALTKDLDLLPDRAVVLASMLEPNTAYPGTFVRAMMPLVRDAGARDRPLDYAASLYAAPLVDCEKEYAEIRAAAGSKQPERVEDKIQAAERKCAQTMAVLRFGSAVTSTAASMVSGAGGGSVPELPYYTLGLMLGLEARMATLTELGVQATLFDLLGIEATWWDATNKQFKPAVLGGLVGLAKTSSTAILDISAAIDLLTADGPVDASAVFSVTSRVVASLSAMTKEVVELSAGPSTPELEALEKGVAISQQVLELAQSYASEDWAGAVIGTMSFVLELAEEYQGTKDTELATLTKVLRQYLPLFIEIATAESSTEVNAALQAAFPAGGYKRKFRENLFSLNAYLGAYGGATVSNHFVDASDSSTELQWGKWGGEFALYAPVGAEFSWAISNNWKNSNFGLFVPLVDLGAITTAKWLEQEREEPVDISEGMTMATQETELSEPAPFNLAGLVAPGLYLKFGLFESPVTFGFGATLSPFAHKRTITRRDSVGDVESTREKFLPAVRMGAFLAVDITFLSVGYNKR